MRFMSRKILKQSRLQKVSELRSVMILSHFPNFVPMNMQITGQGTCSDIIQGLVIGWKIILTNIRGIFIEIC